MRIVDNKEKLRLSQIKYGLKNKAVEKLRRTKTLSGKARRVRFGKLTAGDFQIQRLPY